MDATNLKLRSMVTLKTKINRPAPGRIAPNREDRGEERGASGLSSRLGAAIQAPFSTRALLFSTAQRYPVVSLYSITRCPLPIRGRTLERGYRCSILCNPHEIYTQSQTHGCVLQYRLFAKHAVQDPVPVQYMMQACACGGCKMFRGGQRWAVYRANNSIESR